MDSATVITVIDIVTAIKQAFGGNDGVDLLPQDIYDLLKSLSDGEQGNNDIEKLLMYDDEHSALSEISSRLELIDTRLDKEFEVINLGFSFIITSIVSLLSWKFFGWIIRLVSI